MLTVVRNTLEDQFGEAMILYLAPVEEGNMPEVRQAFMEFGLITNERDTDQIISKAMTVMDNLGMTWFGHNQVMQFDEVLVVVWVVPQ